MDEKVWHNIMKKYLESYYSIYNLANNGIIDEMERDNLLKKLIDDIMTTFDSEVRN